MGTNIGAVKGGGTGTLSAGRSLTNLKTMGSENKKQDGGGERLRLKMEEKTGVSRKGEMKTWGGGLWRRGRQDRETG